MGTNVIQGGGRKAGARASRRMGWGSGKGKAEVLVPAAEVAIANNDDPHAFVASFADKIVLIDVSGIAHMASKKQPHLVVREGMSTQQQEYVTRRLEAVVGEGGKPPKAATRASHGRRSIYCIDHIYR